MVESLDSPIPYFVSFPPVLFSYFFFLTLLGLSQVIIVRLNLLTQLALSSNLRLHAVAFYSRKKNHDNLSMADQQGIQILQFHAIQKKLLG